MSRGAILADESVALLAEDRRALFLAARAEWELSAADLLAVRDLTEIAAIRDPALDAVLLAVFRSVEEGSLCLPIERAVLAARLEPILGAAASAAVDSFHAHLAAGDYAALIGGTEDYRPLIQENGFLAFQRFHLADRELYDRIEVFAGHAAIQPLAAFEAIRSALDEVRAAPDRLDEIQARAVALALMSGLAVISGGPGTGKTSVIVAILRSLIRLGVGIDEIALTAPTGRAAHRMVEAIRAKIGAAAPHRKPEWGHEARGGQAVPSATCDILSPPRTLAPTRPPAPRRALFGGAAAGGQAVPPAPRRALFGGAAAGGQAVPPAPRRALFGGAADETSGIDAPLLELRGVTLHRLLGYRPSNGRFRHHRWNPVEARIVIVDETSMVDALMMARLLEALRPESRLILVGDKDQLPSVDLGAVLAWLAPGDAAPIPSDLDEALTEVIGSPRKQKMEAQAPSPAQGRERTRVSPSPQSVLSPLLAGRVVTLEKNYRAESEEIQKVARAVNVQDKAILKDLREEEASPERAGEFSRGGTGCLRLRLEAGVGDGLYAAWADAYLDDGRYRALVDQFEERDLGALEESRDLLEELFTISLATQILTAVREGPQGCDRINRYLARRYAEAMGGVRLENAPGYPILILDNHYPLELWNGDRGIVLRGRVNGRQERRAIFRRQGEFVARPLEYLPRFAAAFAMTVHKSQGSEFDRVLLVLPAEGGGRILSKEILYTGLTRAKKGVALLATPGALSACLDRRIERHSGFFSPEIGPGK
jgi:hypothetical protein